MSRLADGHGDRHRDNVKTGVRLATWDIELR